MRKESQRYLENDPVDQKLAKLYNRTDQQRAEELDAAKASVSKDDLPNPPEGELQEIMDRIEKEYYADPSQHKRTNVRKMVKMLAAAAVLGTMVIGGSMWVGAKRYYTYESQERNDVYNVMAFDNSPDNLVMNGKDEERKAYEEIGKELNIKVLELSYLPDKIIFSEYEIRSRKGLIKFRNELDTLFFYQGISDKPSSLGYISDMEEAGKVYNQYLDMEISIYRQKLDDGREEYSMIINGDNTYYILEGIIEEGEFTKIVSGIKPFEK